VKRISRYATVSLIVGLASILSSCTKPLPSITLQSGTQSVHAQALCWNDTDQSKFRSCVTKLATNPNLAGTPLTVTAGNVLGITVDPHATEFGWQASVDGSPLFSTPKTSTYYRFVLPESSASNPNGSNIQIVAFGPSNSVRGVWLFKLTNN